LSADHASKEFPESCLSIVSANIEPLTFIFADDGLVPNNPVPFLVYKAAVDVDNEHPEKTIEGLFGANGWGAMWRNGVFDYLHYHATVHEALGVARGARGCGSAAMPARSLRLPPATSRSCPPAPGISVSRRAMISCVVGAYPPGPPMDLVAGADTAGPCEALKTIPQVKLPKTIRCSASMAGS